LKAVILVGGQGTRLQPLTCTTPKAMVPVLGRPFLEHVLIYLSKHGIKELVLAMGYLPDPIQKGLGDGSRLGVRLIYSVEKTPMGTAGAVKNAEVYLDEPFVVLNGDVLTDINLTDMMAKHQAAGPKVSIALTPVDNPTVYGVVETDSTNRVLRFVEKPGWDKVTTNMINAGVYIVEPGVLNFIPANTPFMFEHHLFPYLLDNNYPIIAYPSRDYWIDIGTPKKYLQAHHDLLLKSGRSGIITEDVNNRLDTGVRVEGPVMVGKECVIENGVQIIGPAVIGPYCTIGKGSLIDGAVLWENTKIGENTTIRNCIIGCGNNIEDNCQILDECVLGDNVNIGTGSKLAPGARIWPSTVIKPNTTKF
jgi:mannose-1-phosphate guanylyltransferase